MKLTLILLLFAATASGQITTPKEFKPVLIGKAGPLGTVLAQLEYSIEGQDTMYILTFKDAKYERIVARKSVVFKETGGVKDQLYTVFKSVFSDENKSNKQFTVTFKLGDEEVIVKRYSGLGAALTFFAKSGYVHLTENQVDKLFGK